MTKLEVSNRSFVEVRAQLLDIAAFLDRIDRADGKEDFRVTALLEASKLLSDGQPERTRRILELLSRPGMEPEQNPQGKSACGAPRPDQF
jgi:hypothetical protein